MNIDYWSEIEEWRQIDGLISPRERNPSPDSTGNGILYLSLAHICAVLNRFEIKALEYSLILQSCYTSQYPGILNRSPSKENDQNGWDDYIGVGAACYLMGIPNVSWVSLNAGNIRRFVFFKWFFKNNKPDQFNIFSKETWQAWFGRNPSVITHLQLCSSVWPHALRNLWWSLDTFRKAIFSVGKNHQSVILTYLQVICWDRHWNKPWYIKKSVDFFKRQLKYKYGDFKGVLAYELDQNQPIIKYWPDSV